jgi:hypothetical protein
MELAVEVRSARSVGVRSNRAASCPSEPPVASQVQ